MNNNSEDIIGFAFCAVFLFIFVVGLIWGAFALSQVYKVWSSGKDGEAQLAQANYNRQIAVKEAEAKSAAATELAKAEVIRAGGVAAANKIIGDSLKNNEEYLRYLYVNNLENSHNQIIYVPTEAGLPILEANRLNKGK
jgi:uncharacterized iron-regulated membrane protein